MPFVRWSIKSSKSDGTDTTNKDANDMSDTDSVEVPNAQPKKYDPESPEQTTDNFNDECSPSTKPPETDSSGQFKLPQMPIQ